MRLELESGGQVQIAVADDEWKQQPSMDGSVAWTFEGEQKDPYVQEHIHLVTAIRTGDYVNEAERTAESTLTAIMGRTAAYTGKEVTWQEMMDSDMKYEAPRDKRGRISPIANVPVAGTGVREPRTD